MAEERPINLYFYSAQLCCNKQIYLSLFCIYYKHYAYKPIYHLGYNDNHSPIQR